MSEFIVCRTADTYQALRYCLLLDGDRIAGGKPDYIGNNILISWNTKETYGAVDELIKENAKLRELMREMYDFMRISEKLNAHIKLSPNETCSFANRMRELGMEVE